MSVLEVESLKKRLLEELPLSHRRALDAHLRSTQVNLAKPLDINHTVSSEAEFDESYWRGHYQGLLLVWNFLHDPDLAKNSKKRS